MFNSLKTQVGGKTWSELTPEVKAGFDQMIAIVDDTISPAIIRDFHHTQEHLTVLKNDFIGTSGSAVSHKGQADTADGHRYDCYAMENSMVCTYEDCKAVEKTKCDREVEECAQVVYSETWMLPDRHFTPKTCDLETDTTHESCADIADLMGSADEIGREIEHTYDIYTRELAECEDWKQQCADQVAECTHQKSEMDAKILECIALEFQAESAMCSFGNALQEKCADYMELTGFISKTETELGDGFSEVDRQNEWHAVQTIRCQLENYKEHDGTFDEAAKAECEGRIDYAADVGVLDYYESEWEAESTLQYMDCVETPPTDTVFHGRKWTKNAECASYSDNEAAYPVTIFPETNDPYTFCAA